MAYATGETAYFDKADAMLNNGKYESGVFRGVSGSLPNEGPNRYQELDNGTLPNICRYYSIARTQAMKDKVKALVGQFMAHWTSLGDSPFGFPQHPLNRTTSFGNVVQVERLTFAMLAVADYMNDSTAYGYAVSGFNFLTGLNPYATSYIQGLGDPAITPSVNFLKRSYEDGIGAMLPGFTNDGTSFIQNYAKYQSTEGVVPTSSTLFYMLSRLNTLHSTVPTNIPVTIETETQSNFYKFHLYDNYPNPFNPETTISFDLPGRSIVKLEIYNILGQLVKTIIDYELSPASYNYKWDGKDKNGHFSGTGIYLYHLESSFGTEVKKMTLIK